MCRQYLCFSASAMNSSRRCRLYSLLENGTWADVCTGYPIVASNHLRVHDDAAADIVLDVPIGPPLQFNLQSDRIIAWRNLGTDDDMALSFQDTNGCAETWNLIAASLQSVDASAAASGSAFHNSEKDTHKSPPQPSTSPSSSLLSSTTLPLSGEKRRRASWEITGVDDDVHAIQSQMDYHSNEHAHAANLFIDNPLTEDLMGASGSLLNRSNPLTESSGVILAERIDGDIPLSQSSVQSEKVRPNITHAITQYLMMPSESINVDNVAELLNVIHGDIRNGARMEIIDYLVQRDSMHLRKLLDIFKTNESAIRTQPELLELFGTFGIDLMMLNEPGIVELLIEDAYFVCVVGLLVIGLHIASADITTIAARQDYITTTNTEPEHVKQQLVRYFRVNFIRDHVLPRNFDENVVGNLQSMASLLATGVIRTLTETDTSYFTKLLDTISNANGSAFTREITVLVIAEYCVMSRISLTAQKVAFIRLLLEAAVPIFRALEPTLADRNASRREVLAALDIINYVMQMDPPCLRIYLLKNRRMSGAPRGGGEVLPLSEVPASGSLDDGYSIRLHERLELLGFDTARPTLEMLNFCISGLERGEHGVLVRGVDRFSPLLLCLTWRLVDDPDTGIQILSSDILMSLLHTATLSSDEKEAFLGIWYEHFAPQLFSPFCHDKLPPVKSTDGKAAMDVLSARLREGARVHGCLLPLRRADVGDVLRQLGSGYDDADAGIGCESSVSKHSKLLVLEIILLSLELHGYRVKYLFLRNKLLEKIPRLCRYNEKQVLVSVVRVLKLFMMHDDHFYIRSALLQHLPSALMAVLIKTRGKDNLVTSTVLETLAALKHAKNKEPWDVIATNFDPLLQVLIQHDWIRAVLDMKKAPIVARPLSAVPSPMKAPSLIDEEAKYFESDDEVVAPQLPQAPVVDEFDFFDEFAPPTVQNTKKSDDDAFPFTRTLPLPQSGTISRLTPTAPAAGNRQQPPKKLAIAWKSALS